MAQMEWFPITEKLPNAYETVIVSTSVNDVTLAYLLPNKRWVEVDCEGFLVERKVTAWMPFPTPYEGEKDEQ